MPDIENGLSELFQARETAEQAAPRAMTENEAYAIAADRVQRETADLTTKVTALEAEKAELQSKLDEVEIALNAEKAAREKAEQDLQDHKDAVEAEQAKQERIESRTAAAKEKLTGQPDGFFTAERAERWASMEDDAFAAYLSEMAEVASSHSGPTTPSTTTEPPRETAMQGQSPSGDQKVTSIFKIARGA